jgi:FkbM family methyltransferase
MLERALQKLGYYSEKEAIRRFKPKAAAFQFYCQYLGPGDIVVEAGAFRGFTTVGLLANIVKLIYAFEPNPDNFRHLKENSRGANRIRIFNLGLGDHEEVVEIRGSADFSSFVDREQSPGPKARIVSLDSLNLDPSPTALILDCEGMELEAITGAQKTIAKSIRSVLVETHPPYSTETKVGDILSNAGFSDVQVRDSGWNKEGAYHGTWVLARKP